MKPIDEIINSHYRYLARLRYRRNKAQSVIQNIDPKIERLEIIIKKDEAKKAKEESKGRAEDKEMQNEIAIQIQQKITAANPPLYSTEE